jgi:hypothetical protein
LGHQATIGGVQQSIFYPLFPKTGGYYHCFKLRERRRDRRQWGGWVYRVERRSRKGAKSVVLFPVNFLARGEVVKGGL